MLQSALMQVTIPHTFTKQQALMRVKEALDQARSKIGEQATITEERWEGNTLHFGFTGQGQSISGTFMVRDTEFELYAKLPLMMKLFEKKIEAAIQEQAQKILGA